jgi:hypothetical protein
VHVPNAPRAVATTTRQHDRDRAPAAILRKRAEEDVDRKGQLLLPIALAQQKTPARDDHLFLGRNQVHAIGLHRHAVFHQMDRKRRVPGQQLVHQALEVR